MVNQIRRDGRSVAVSTLLHQRRRIGLLEGSFPRSCTAPVLCRAVFLCTRQDYAWLSVHKNLMIPSGSISVLAWVGSLARCYSLFCNKSILPLVIRKASRSPGRLALRWVVWSVRGAPVPPPSLAIRCASSVPRLVTNNPRKRASSSLPARDIC